ncbi:MAG: Gfo/Idh/MocA family oxidoreductase [Clostridiaceae bacterium]|nr:Gfo/Idh/MocA family oxidoreductase [Clostridiaceae bacterium]
MKRSSERNKISPTDSAAERTIRIGIAGFGNMGRNHLGNIVGGKVPGLELTAIFDRNADKFPALREEFAASCPNLRFFDDYAALLKSGLCDAVIIAVPHMQHPEYAIAALEAGLHVLLEKPAGVDTMSVQEMIAEAEKRPEQAFAMVFNQRGNPVYRQLKSIIDSGELGAIRRVNWLITDWYRTQSYYDSSSWRGTWGGEGGGVLINQCPHNLDLWQWLCGMPTKLRAWTHEALWHDIEVEDDVTAYVEYENGATGVFVTTTGEWPGTNRLEISFSQGRVECTPERLTVYRLDKSLDDFTFAPHTGLAYPAVERIEVDVDAFLNDDDAFPESDSLSEPDALPDTDEALNLQHMRNFRADNLGHIGILRNFAAHLFHGEPLIAPGSDGLPALQLSNAMHLSSWTGREVSLPLSVADATEFKSLLKGRMKTSKYDPTRRGTGTFDVMKPTI